MNKMKGIWVLICKSPKCENLNGWPLIVLRSLRGDKKINSDNTASDRYNVEGRHVGVPGLTYDRANMITSGVCPNCFTPFWFKNLTGYIPGIISWTVPFHAQIEEHSPHLMLAEDIENRRTHTDHRNVVVTEIPDLPSRKGLQTLRVASKEKQGFTRALRRAQQAGLTAEDLPDWAPQASDTQFKEWTRQIDQQLFLRDTIPVAVATAGQPLSNEDMPKIAEQVFERHIYHD